MNALYNNWINHNVFSICFLYSFKFFLQLLCISLVPLTFPCSAQILLENALFCRQNARLNNRLFCSKFCQQKLSQPKASVCCVSFEPQRQPWLTFWNPQHRTELIVNLKQSHKSELFSIRLWSRSVIHKEQCESKTRKLLLHHLRKRIHVMNKIKRVRWSYVYRTLDIDAPWLKHWHKSIISIWKEDLWHRQCQLFPICNCGFGIWVNCDAVLQYSRATMCGIMVFVPPLRPPLKTNTVKPHV